MALEYLREYRKYLHVATSYRISEILCYRNIKWIEDVPIKHPDFSLSNHESLLKIDREYAVILMDATENAYSAPKKVQNKKRINNLNKKAFLFREKEKPYFKDTRFCRRKDELIYIHPFCN